MYDVFLSPSNLCMSQSKKCLQQLTPILAHILTALLGLGEPAVSKSSPSCKYEEQEHQHVYCPSRTRLPGFGC